MIRDWLLSGFGCFVSAESYTYARAHEYCPAETKQSNPLSNQISLLGIVLGHIDNKTGRTRFTQWPKERLKCRHPTRG